MRGQTGEKEALENGNTGRLDERKSNIEEEVKSVTVKVLETGNTGGLNWRKLDNEGRYKQTGRYQILKTGLKEIK